MRIFLVSTLALIVFSGLLLLAGAALGAKIVASVGLVALGVLICLTGGFWVGLPLIVLVLHWAMPGKFPLF